MVVIVVALASVGCGIPRDPEGTLDRVRGATMHVGVTDNPPWVELGEGAPTGLEVELVERFAAGIEAEIEWIEGSEEELFAALEVHELDLVVGGITSVSPWASVAALTHPYLTTACLVAVPEGHEPPDDIAGLEVGVESSSELEGLLRRTDARVIEVEDIAAHEGAVAIDNYLLDDLDVVDTGVRLGETDHVFAVPMGENDWMTTIERFLLERPDDIEELLLEFGAP